MCLHFLDWHIGRRPATSNTLSCQGRRSDSAKYRVYSGLISLAPTVWLHCALTYRLARWLGTSLESPCLMVPYSRIRPPPVRANIHKGEFIVVVYNRQQNQAVVPLIVVIICTRVGRASDAKMFPINGSHAVREIPAGVESIRDLTPGLLCADCLQGCIFYSFALQKTMQKTCVP